MNDYDIDTSERYRAYLCLIKNELQKYSFLLLNSVLQKTARKKVEVET